MEEQISADIKRLREAVEALGEHFDAVQIFATRHESGEHRGTGNWALGTGNWYARYGQIRSWLLRNEFVEQRGVGDEDEED